MGEKQENKHPMVANFTQGWLALLYSIEGCWEQRAGGPRSGRARAWDPASLCQSMNPQREKMHIAAPSRTELSFPTAAILIAVHGWLNPTKAFSHRSGGYKSTLSVGRASSPRTLWGRVLVPPPPTPGFLQLCSPCQPLAGSSMEPVSPLSQSCSLSASSPLLLRTGGPS